MFGGTYFGSLPFGDLADGQGTGEPTIILARMIPDQWGFRIPHDSEHTV